MSVQVYSQFYEGIGFSKEDANVLGGLLELARNVNEDLIREGKPGLLDRLRERRRKEAEQAEPNQGES